ncbi:Iron-sulfur cluster carrier protein [Burkholderia lata]|nr:Iron-sulfur cluster carrier protein [Burkholderia lata]
MATTYPIYLVGGSKGGVGKSFVSLALADYLQRRDHPVALVETDTSSPDVMKAIQDDVPCIAYSLDVSDRITTPLCRNRCALMLRVHVDSWYQSV